MNDNPLTVLARELGDDFSRQRSGDDSGAEAAGRIEIALYFFH